MVETPWGDSESLRERRLPPGPGKSPEEVHANQRERLFGAMVASVAARGYAATRVADLVEISGVSSRSFYGLFPDKEACFLATLDALLSGVQATGFEGGIDERGKIRQGIAGFTAAVAAQPAAARLCLVEAHAAGAPAVERLDGAVAEFEARAQRASRAWSGAAPFPEEMVRAYLGALIGLARARLRRGEEGELPALVDELTATVASYVPPPAPLRLGERPAAAVEESLEGADHVERIFRALAVVVAEEGYAEATVEQISRRAGISGSRFYTHFRDKEDATLAAIDSTAAQMVAAAMPAFRRHGEWRRGIRTGLSALFSFLASRPALARLVMVEVYAVGPAAVALREEALRPLRMLFGEGAAETREAAPVALEAIAAGVFHLVEERIRRSGPADLPSLAPICSYIALAPFVGPEAACTVANAEGDLRGPAPPDAELVREIDRQPIKHQTVAYLARGPRALPEIAAALDRPKDLVLRHLEELEQANLVERFEDPADGEDRYRTDVEIVGTERWDQLETIERQRRSARFVHLVESEVHIALDAATFDSRPELVMVRVPMVVDERGWREISGVHLQTMEEIIRLTRESEARLAEKGGQPIRARTFLLHFPMPD